MINRIGQIPTLLLCLTLISGCERLNSGRGLGGGAEEPVTVRLLLEELPDTELETEEDEEADPITEFGNVSGHVRIAGALRNPSVLPVLSLNRSNELPVSDFLSESGAVRDVFIYLTKKPNAAMAVAAVPEIAVTQTPTPSLVPRAQILPIGQAIQVTATGKSVNLRFEGAKVSQTVVASPNMPASVTFKNAEIFPVAVYSAENGNRLGSVLPLDHPWASVSNNDGEFEITDVPVGEWEFSVWHETVGMMQTGLMVEVLEGGTTEVDIQIDFSKLTNRTSN